MKDDFMKEEEEPLTVRLSKEELEEILRWCDYVDAENVYRFFREKERLATLAHSGFNKLWDVAIANGIMDKSFKPDWLE
jgi:hypothetical protein